MDVPRRLNPAVESGLGSELNTIAIVLREEETSLSSTRSDEKSEDSTFIIKIGEKQFECPFCGGIYKSKTYVYTHIGSVHLGLKPFPCPKCGMAFATRESLKVHIRSKNGCRFDCNVCQQRFITRETLDSHVCTEQVSTSTSRSQPEQLATEAWTSSTTNGEKPTCPKCFKTFANGYNLKRHDDAVHYGLRPWPCLICGRVFKCKQIVQKHTARNTCKPRPTTSMKQSNGHRLESLVR
jgi:uncharacterized Zn-finger protein